MENSDKKHEEAHESELLRFLKDRGDPFVPPEGYFKEQLKQTMANLSDEEDQEESPSFGERQAEVFHTPENYFNDFSQKLMAQLPPKEAKRVSLNKYWFPAAIAAAIALLIAFGWMGIQTDTSNQFLSEGMDGFSEAEMLAILEQENLEAEDLLALLPTESLLNQSSFEDQKLDEDLEAFFNELDNSDLEAILLE